jgi:hypothetical protein
VVGRLEVEKLEVGKLEVGKLEVGKLEGGRKATDGVCNGRRGRFWSFFCASVAWGS